MDKVKVPIILTPIKISDYQTLSVQVGCLPAQKEMVTMILDKRLSAHFICYSFVQKSKGIDSIIYIDIKSEIIKHCGFYLQNYVTHGST